MLLKLIAGKGHIAPGKGDATLAEPWSPGYFCPLEVVRSDIVICSGSFPDGRDPK